MWWGKPYILGFPVRVGGGIVAVIVESFKAVEDPFGTASSCTCLCPGRIRNPRILQSASMEGANSKPRKEGPPLPCKELAEITMINSPESKKQNRVA